MGGKNIKKSKEIIITSQDSGYIYGQGVVISEGHTGTFGVLSMYYFFNLTDMCYVLCGVIHFIIKNIVLEKVNDPRTKPPGQTDLPLHFVRHIEKI